MEVVLGIPIPASENAQVYTASTMLLHQRSLTIFVGHKALIEIEALNPT